MKKLLWGLSILAGAFVVAIVLRGGSGGVTEFSPDTLEHRSQSEILCPVIEVPLFRGPLEYYEHELVRFLVKKGYWQPRKVDSPRWLLLVHRNPAWRDGDSVLGHELFGRKASWIEWTEKNPAEAAQLWPHVLKLLRQRDKEQAVELLREVRL